MTYIKDWVTYANELSVSIFWHFLLLHIISQDIDIPKLLTRCSLLVSGSMLCSSLLGVRTKTSAVNMQLLEEQSSASHNSPSREE